MRLFSFLLLGVFLGCASSPVKNNPPQKNTTNFQFSGMYRFARLIEERMNKGEVVNLAFATNMDADWNQDISLEEQKRGRDTAIQHYESVSISELREYFVGNSSFSIVDAHGLTPIDKANYIVSTDFHYYPDRAIYYGKLIDVKRETTIDYFQCSHGSTAESIVCR